MIILDIGRMDNENFDDFTLRVIDNKEILELENAEIYSLLYGMNISSDEARKRLRGVKIHLETKQDLNEDVLISDLPTTLDLQRIELEKERVRIADQKREYSKLVRSNARFEHLRNEIIKNFTPYEIDFKYNPNASEEKTAVLVLTDWHVGLQTANYWNEYNINIFYERLEEILNKTIDYCKFHNVNRLILLGLGDFVNGIIHISIRVANDENIINQIKIASSALAGFIKKLAENINQVDFFMTVGNHGRVHPEKDSLGESENFEHLINWFLEEKFRNTENVIIHDNCYDDGIIVFDLYGRKYFATHGSLDKMNDAIENLTLMIREVPECIFLGDKHHLELNERHGIEVYTCRSLAGVDEYAKGLRRTSRAGQDLFIFDEEIGLECHYSIKVD